MANVIDAVLPYLNLILSIWIFILAVKLMLRDSYAMSIIYCAVAAYDAYHFLK